MSSKKAAAPAAATRSAVKKSRSDDESERHPVSDLTDVKMQEHMTAMEMQLRLYQQRMEEMMQRMQRMEEKAAADASELRRTRSELDTAHSVQQDTAAVLNTTVGVMEDAMKYAGDELKEASQRNDELKEASQRNMSAMKPGAEKLQQMASIRTQPTTTNTTRQRMGNTSDPSSSSDDDDDGNKSDDDGPSIRTHSSSISHRSEKLYRGINLPKMPVKMSKFSGVNKEENVQNWVDEFHTLKVATGWRSKETIALAGLHLTQVARNWFNHIGYKYATWDSFSRAMVKEYGRQYSPHLIRELVSQMPAQKENESCSEFLGRVRTRLNEYGVYEDKEIADAFLERMRPEWKQQVLGNIGDTRVSSMDILAIASKWEIAVKAASNARKVRAATSSTTDTVVLGTNPVTEVTVHNELAIRKKFAGTCNYCGKVGHMLRHCKARIRKEEDKGGDKSANQGSGNKGTREREGKECSHCKMKGHEEAQCWKKHPELAPKRNVRTMNNNQEGEKEERVIVKAVPRERGVDITCAEREKGTYVVDGRIGNMCIPITIDIGADDTSCIAEHVFMQLPAPIRSRLIRSNRPLSNVDNSSLSHLGKVDVDLQLDPIGCADSRQVLVTMYVVPDLSVACLLGSDFTEKYTKCIAFKDRFMELVTGEKIHINVRTRVKQQPQNSPSHTVMLSKDITLEPYSAVITPHACALMPDSSSGSVWLTEANEAVLGDGVLVARTAQDLPTKLARGRTRVVLQLTNTTSKPITYKAGRRIATLQPIDVMVAAEEEEKRSSEDVKSSIGKEIEEHISKADEGSAIHGTPYQQQMQDLLMEYAHLFDNRAPGAARMDGEVVEHSIVTGQAYPIARPPRRQSPAMEAVIEKEVKNLLDAKVIRPSNSPWASNLVLVRKKDGTWRPCVDFRELNAVTETDVYPIPAIDQLLYNMQGAKVFSCMDLQGAYHQIRISEQDQKKTAFIFRGGLYEYIRMPFGLKNAPATFQRFMNMMLSTGGLRTFVMAYLDDLVVFSRNMEEHMDHVRQTLAVLSRHGVKLKLSKCQFGMNRIRYLGHVLDGDGVHVDPEYIRAVTDMPDPTNISELRTFLGMAGYYRGFIPAYAKIAQPLYELMKKQVTWRWDEAQKQATSQLKQALTSAPVLLMPDYSKPFIIQTDASTHGIGAVLSQTVTDASTGADVERPIAYVSRSLKPAETRYAATHLEMLAVMYGINKFRHYVGGSKFLLQTDHRALEGIMKSKDLQGRMARWVTTLQEYDFQLQYRKGTANGNADALSRLPVQHVVAALHQPAVPAAGVGEEKEEKQEQEEKREQKQAGDADSKSNADGKEQPELEAEDFDGIDIKEVPRLQMEDPMWRDIYTYVSEQKHNDLASQDEKDKLERECEQYLIKDDGLLFHIHLANGQPQTHNVMLQLCIPRALVPAILKEMHDEPYSGHRGTEGTYGKLMHRYWWKGMHRDTKQYCMSCVVCAQRKVPHRHGDIPMLSPQVEHQYSFAPFECLAIDCFGPLPTSGGNQQLAHGLTMTCATTRWGEAVPIRRQTTENIAYQVVHRWILRYGFPRYIISDNGPGFASRVMKRCMKMLGVKVKYILPYRPQSNGICERLNGTIKSMLGCYTQKSQKEWADLLPYIVFAYNTSVHNATGYTPYYLVHGREACIGSEAVLRGEGETRTLPEYVKSIQRNMALAQKHVKDRVNAAADQRDRMNDMLRHPVKYHVGDEVYVYQLPKSDGKNDITRKLISPYQGPYRVTKVISDVAYQVEHETTKKKKSVHVSKMKKVHKRPEHLIPPEEREQIPILPGALDEMNQQQGDQFQTHATRRQRQREAHERKIQEAMQQHAQPQEEQEEKYDEARHAQGTADYQEPVLGPVLSSAAAHLVDVSRFESQGEDEGDDELEEGEVRM
jgi:hypothetical protein